MTTIGVISLVLLKGTMLDEVNDPTAAPVPAQGVGMKFPVLTPIGGSPRLKIRAFRSTYVVN